jgi:hypothetical protein
LGGILNLCTATSRKWMGASAQIAAIEKTTKNPSVITRLLTGSGNIEAIATQAVLARKQLEQQRYDLKIWVSMTYGIRTWEEILRTEGLLRKQQGRLPIEQQQAFFAKVFLGASSFCYCRHRRRAAVLFCNVSERTATMTESDGNPRSSGSHTRNGHGRPARRHGAQNGSRQARASRVYHGCC